MALRSTVAYHAEFLTLNRALDLQVDVYSDLEYNHDMEWNRYLNPDLYRAQTSFRASCYLVVTSWY